MTEFLTSTQGTQVTPHTIGWPWEPIILSIGHFQGITKIQLNSW